MSPLTEKLLSCCKVKGFFICHIRINFSFELLDCVRYNEDFVISRFCSIHFTVTLAGLKNIVFYTKDFVK